MSVCSLKNRAFGPEKLEGHCVLKWSLSRSANLLNYLARTYLPMGTSNFRVQNDPKILGLKRVKGKKMS